MNDNMVVEPRTTVQIVADLLQAAIDGQWSDEINTECHCHPNYVRCCSKCGSLESTGEHEKVCELASLIEAARAFLRVENALAEERGEDTVYVP